MHHYLFVHFKEKTTPDGEQVYFGLSKDGFNWEPVHDGQPILWSYHGDKGVRDFTITRTRKNTFVILATDLSLSYGLRNQYQNDWSNIVKNGSHMFAKWESDDLIHWSKQAMITLGDDTFGCMWAPDIIYDSIADNYLVHWSSPRRHDNFEKMAIYYARTKDFKQFTEPKLLYEKSDSTVIDSAMYQIDDVFYLFVKSFNNPEGVILLKSANITGPFKRVERFDQTIQTLPSPLFEAPTGFLTNDGAFALFLDYYGVKGKGQGYVPFISEDIHQGRFKKATQSFTFPYGFKHGTVLSISADEYHRLKTHRFEE